MPTPKVTEAWLRLIQFTRDAVPHGEITVKIVGGEPTELLASKRRIRFDKPELTPVYFQSEDARDGK